MRTLFTFLFLTFILYNAIGQFRKHKTNNYTIQIDTLSTVNDSALVKLSTFFNDTILQEEKTAYLLPDTIIINRFGLNGNLFKRKTPVTRIFKHGKTIEYSTDGMKKISTYKNDILISTYYIDKNNSEISKSEYNNGEIIIGPCGIVIMETLIIGTKEKNKKRHRKN